MSVLKYTKDHEWIRIDGEIGTVGISPYAQQQLGDIVFVELPEVGQSVAQGGEVAVVESVKAASEIYAPIDGEVTEVNSALADEPAQVNNDPLGAGWFFRVRIVSPNQLDALMDEEAYQHYLGDLA